MTSSSGSGGGAGGGGDAPLAVKKMPQPRQKNSTKQQVAHQQSLANTSSLQQQPIAARPTNNSTPISNNHLGAVYRAKTFGTPVPSLATGRPIVKAPESPQGRNTGVAASPVMKSLPALHYPAMDSLSERIKQAKLQKVMSAGGGSSSTGVPPCGATPRPPLHAGQQQKAQQTTVQQQRAFTGPVQNQRSTPPTAASPMLANQAVKQQTGQQRQPAAQSQQNQTQQTIEFNKKQTSMSCQQKYQRDTTCTNSDNDERMEVDSGASEGGVDGEANNFSNDAQNNEERDGSSASVAYLQKVIENPSTTIVQNQIDGNTVKMLVVLQNEEQRLITFDIPNEPCTVQDLLEQVSVRFRFFFFFTSL